MNFFGALRRLSLVVAMLAFACGETNDAPMGGGGRGGGGAGARDAEPEHHDPVIDAAGGSNAGAAGSTDGSAADALSMDVVPEDADARVDMRDAYGPDVSIGPGPSMTFNPFTDVYVWGDHEGGTQQIFDKVVDFPPMPLTYKTITITIALKCPNAAVRSCDYVDQRGFVGVVDRTGPVETVHEIQRFITPYGSPATFTADVTSLRPLLSGSVLLRLWVDTWAHQGSNIGDGWRVDVSLELTGGVPARLPIAVVPLWGETKFDYGDPQKPIAGSVGTKSFTIPPEAKRVELFSFITGHGQGNSENCGEFCPKNHTYTVGGKPFTKQIWRTDCAMTGSRDQTSGAYVYSRAGWCPGATVLPWVVDVTAAAPAGATGQVSYDVQAYTNTCQPSTCTLQSCAFYGTQYFNGSCIYDQQFHAVPYY